MLALLVAVALTQTPQHRLFRQPNLPARASSGPSCTVANLLTNSKAFDNAAWLKEGGGAASPTVTANAGTAPDGTETADRVQFANTTGANYSDIYQLLSGSGTTSCSVYVKGFSGDGTIDLSMQANVSTWTAAPCSFVNESWTECKQENFSRHNGGGFFIGNSGYANGSQARSGTDVLLWGAQCVAAATAPNCVARARLHEALEMLAVRPVIQPWRVR